MGKGQGESLSRLGLRYLLDRHITVGTFDNSDFTTATVNEDCDNISHIRIGLHRNRLIKLLNSEFVVLSERGFTESNLLAR